MKTISHSVTLDEDKCKGCTNCIKHCPTEAIRVRKGKARIISERCIDCGECIRVCPYHAKRAVCDSMAMMGRFAHTIALPAPSLYGQFSNLSDIDFVLNGLLEMGFDEIYEVSKAAEIASSASRQLMGGGGLETPVISSACPAVVRLIRVKFPGLCGHVHPMLSPMQIAGRLAKEECSERTGLPCDQIGAFFISPCPAKATDVAAPIGTASSWVDGVFSMADVYPKLLERMNKIEYPKKLAKSGIIGVSWAKSGGEASALYNAQYLAADGIDSVISVLEELEGDRLQDLSFIELNACRGGCVGGALTVENPYVAKARLYQFRKHLPVSLNRLDGMPLESLLWNQELEYTGVLRLSEDLGEAMAMMEAINGLEERLPGLDCGSCGAPSCRALAEDIVTGQQARLNDCIFILRQEASVAGIEVSRPNSSEEEE